MRHKHQDFFFLALALPGDYLSGQIPKTIMEHLYEFLYNVGYREPIHPAIVHIPIGAFTCAFVLGILSLGLRRPGLGRAAWYTLIVSFVSIFPTIFFGFEDWQRFFAGGWLFQIKMKLALAAVLLVASFMAVIAGRRGERTSGRGAGLSLLCLFLVIGLGWFGGRLVYGGRVPPTLRALRPGEKLFLYNCSGCHPYGGNMVDADEPLRGSPALKNDEIFVRWIRDPRLDNGSRGVMPPFPSARIPDAQAGELRKYLAKMNSESGQEG